MTKPDLLPFTDSELAWKEGTRSHLRGHGKGTEPFVSKAEKQHPSVRALPCELLITEMSPVISLQCRGRLLLT